MNKRILVWILALFVSGSVFAGGTPEPYKEVQGKENWYYDYDITKMEPGKYNLVIQAQDKAGNLQVIGPFNLNVDPNSDIPQVTIQSPLKGMRSTGKVNVVGTAVDDDAVDFVELQLGEDGPLIRANGKRFWSYYMDIGDLPDGEYQIRARATDIKGVQSPWATVKFHLDQYKPLIQVTNHKVGEILRAGSNLAGEVTEANGIKELSWSTSSQGPFQPIGFSFDEKEKKYRYTLDVNTNSLKDGPQVFWFRAINNLGNEGTLAYLFFVDNTPPKVEILFPGAKDASPGKIFIVGQNIEDVGMESLTWNIVDPSSTSDPAKNSGEIKLIPGNPFWTLPLDFSKETSEGKTVKFTAVDKTGNSSTTEFKFLLDKEADRPILALDTPIAKEQYQDKVELRGWVRDDDQVASVTWTLASGGTGTVETKGAFNILLPLQSAGPQKVTVVAKDVFGLESLPKTVEFTFVPEKPTIAFSEVVWGASGKEGTGQTRAAYIPGVLVPADKTQSLIGKVKSLDKGTLAEVILGNGKPQALGLQETATGELSFNINISDDLLDRGTNLITVKVKDTFGREVSSQAVVVNYLNDLWENRLKDGAVGEQFALTLDPKMDPKEKGVKRPFLVVGNQALANGRVNLVPETPFQIVYFEETFTKGITVELVPSTPLFSVVAEPQGTDYHLLKVSANGVGVAKAKVKVTSGKATFETPVFEFNSVVSGPEVQISSPEIGFWAGRELDLKGRVADLIEIETIEYSLDGGQNWRNIPFTQPNKAPVVSGNKPIVLAAVPQKTTTEYAQKIDLKPLSDGNLTILVRAKNRAGLSTTAAMPFYKNLKAPEITILAPMPEKMVNGIVTVVGSWKPATPFKSLEFSDDNGKTFKPVTADSIFSIDVDFSKYKVLPEKFYFKATDASGNTTTIPGIFKVDTEIDKPKVSVQIPDEKEVLKNDFFISGLAVDDDGVQRVFYRLDGKGDFSSVEGTNSFSIPVGLADITDADHFVELYAQDINGTKGNVVKRNFTVSRSGPVSTLLKPDLNTTQKGRVNLEGKSEDPNGVDSVFLSFDNGNTFLKMRGAENWTYPLDTSLLADGVYTLFIKAFDKTGMVGDYTVLFSCDNSAPSISLTSPKDGEEISENINLEGRASDNMNLKQLKYTFKPLDERGAFVSGELPTTGGFSQTIDLTKLSFGWYNLNIEGVDDAGNLTYVARNIQIKQKTQADRIEVVYPAQGEKVSGPVKVEGRYYSKTPQDKVVLFIEGKPFSTLPVNEYGYFSTAISAESLKAYLKPEQLTPGGIANLSLKVESSQESGVRLQSLERSFVYQLQGPWVRIQSHKIGDFITKRPYLSGYFGYYFEPQTPPVDPQNPPPDPVYGPKKLTARQIMDSPVVFELSLDNGLSFIPLGYGDAYSTQENPLDKGTKEWRYRIETQNFPQGDLTFLMRATFADGSVATYRQILVVDEIKPKLEILSPGEEGRYNEVIKIIGTAGDENSLDKVSLLLRKGDKAFTQVPTFIQGMYFDAYALGATLWSTGFGLTFFDQNVKLQVQLGNTPSGRFNGYVAGLKLLANVAYLPWEYFFGPDWTWIASSVGIGANFSYFSMQPELVFNNKSVILGAMLAQFEPLRLKLESWPIFKSIGFYFETSFWFISSDIQATQELRYSGGVRLQLF